MSAADLLPAGLILALLIAIVVALAARSDAAEGRRATLEALDIVRATWPSIAVMRLADDEGMRRAAEVVNAALEDINDVLLGLPLPEREEPVSLTEDGKPLEVEREGVPTAREGAAHRG